MDGKLSMERCVYFGSMVVKFLMNLENIKGKENDDDSDDELNDDEEDDDNVFSDNEVYPCCGVGIMVVGNIFRRLYKIGLLNISF